VKGGGMGQHFCLDCSLNSIFLGLRTMMIILGQRKIILISNLVSLHYNIPVYTKKCIKAFCKQCLSVYLFFARFLQITTATIASMTARHPATIVMIPTVVLKKGVGGGTVGLVAFTERILNTWWKSSIYSVLNYS